MIFIYYARTSHGIHGIFNKVHVFIVIATPLILSFDLHSAPSNLNLQSLPCILHPVC